MLSATFKAKEILILALISLTYLIVSWALIGLRPEQFMLILLYNGLYFGSQGARKVILGFSVFVVYWIIFDYMKAFPNYEFGTVRIRDLYDIEVGIFGFTADGIRMTANEYWLCHTVLWLDIVSGLFYLCWIPVPLIFAGFLFFRNRDQFLRFSLTFLIVNLVGFVIYYTYPAAPPWYYREFGIVFHPGTPGNIAGLARFDDYFQAGVFRSIYAKSSNVFAAMPSLHSAYPLVVFYYGVRIKLGMINIFFAIVTTGIWFAAVYTSHHYIIDVIVGILCAIAGILLFNAIARTKLFKSLFTRYLSVIE